MIKINLLGEESAESADNLVWLFAYAASVVFLIGAFLSAYVYLGFSINSVNSQIEIAESQLSKLRERTREVSDLEKKKTEVQAMTLAIAALKKTQQGPVKLLDDVNQAIPDRLWLTLASFKGGVMRLEGIALNDDAVVSFSQNLKQSPFLENVKLIDRITGPLAQINTYNTADGTQARIICRGEKDQVTSRMTEIKSYAEKQGLAFVTGPPDVNLRGAPGSNNSATNGSQTVTKLSFESSSNKKLASGRPTFFAWENVQQVQGANFVLESKMGYTPRGFNLDLLTQTNAAGAIPAKAEAKKPKAAKEE